MLCRIRDIHKTLANLIKRGKPLNPRPEIASCQQQVNTLCQFHILLLVFTNIILQATIKGAWSTSSRYNYVNDPK